MAVRPLDFSQEIADKICDRLKQGISLRKICKPNDFPTKETVFKWLAENPIFQSHYACAKELFSDAEFERMQDIIEDAKTPEQIAQARLKIDTMKWMLGKMRPKKYGDKLAIGGTDELPPIRTQSTLDVSNLTLEQLDALQAAFKGGDKSEA